MYMDIYAQDIFGDTPWGSCEGQVRTERARGGGRSEGVAREGGTRGRSANSTPARDEKWWVVRRR